jgi:hypothetical protein
VKTHLILAQGDRIELDVPAIDLVRELDQALDAGGELAGPFPGRMIPPPGVPAEPVVHPLFFHPSAVSAVCALETWDEFREEHP